MNAHQRRLSRRAAPLTTPEEDLLPDGVWDDSEGRYWAECRGCRRDREVGEGLLADFNIRDFFCGGSPHCIP